MNILAIDLGSYSIKFLDVSIDRKQIQLQHQYELIIDQVRKQFPSELSTLEIQLEVIKNYLEQRPFDGKIILQVPNEYITTRHLTLPVSSKKKAEQMIPFQLDDNIPFPITKAHFVTTLQKKQNNISALVNITQTDDFDQLYQLIEKYKIGINLLVSEFNVFQNFIENWNHPNKKISKMQEPYCILDIGHTTSKAYFVNNNQIVTNHISHVGGKNIDDIISQTYQISRPEAVIYKHDNCFFLTENQYKEVDSDQLEFAKLMRQTFWPLIQDLRRWELGFRSKFGQKISTIYITGGTSNISNCKNFISQALSINAEHFTCYDLIKQKHPALDSNEKNSFALSFTMALSQLAKLPIPNFLSNRYSTSRNETLHLHSTTFIASRVALIAIILLVSLLIEHVILTSDKKHIDKQIITIMKNPDLELSRKDRSDYRRRPHKTLRLFKKRKRTIDKEVKNAKFTSTVNAVEPLITLSKTLLNNEKINLTTFENDYGKVTANFSSTDPKEITNFKSRLERLKFEDMEVENKDPVNITLSFKGN